jgi:hypothetical protein
MSPLSVLTRSFLLALSLTVGLAPHAMAGPSTSSKLAAEISFDALGFFRDGDGRGAFIHSTDGTSCQIDVSTRSSVFQDLDFEMNVLSTSTPRTGYVDLSWPADSASPVIGINPSATMFRAHVYDIYGMSVGATKYDRVYLRANVGGAEYRIRFGESASDGSSYVQFTRTSETEWVINTVDGADVAKVWRLSSSGKFTVTPVGLYRVPFRAVIRLR